MNNHAELLKQVVGTETKGAFWSRELDMSNPSDAECVAAQFGGSDWLHEHYPLMAQAYDYTIRNATPLKASDNKGFCNGVKILDSGFDQNSKVAYSTGMATLTETVQCMCLTLAVYKDDKFIGRKVRFFNGKPSGDIVFQTDDTPDKDGVIYHSYLQASWQPKGDKCIRAMVATAESYGSSKEVVKSINIEHPKHIVTNADSAIKVAYDRKSSSMDYVYDEVRDEKGNERVFLQVEGSVTFEDGCQIDTVNTDNVGMRLSCTGFGDIFYNYEPITYGNTDDCTITPLDNLNGFKWKFNEDWKNSIIDSVRFGNRLNDFQLSFEFTCKNDKAKYSLLVSSCDDDEMVFGQDHTAKISKIHLYWGCLAKGTKVTMASGEKNIEDIVVGDVVMNPDGGTVKVTECFKGSEKNIYNILLENGMEVKASRNHPFATADGFTAVIDLTSETELMTNKGLSKVVYCYPDDYNSDVYNLVLDGGNSFYANGIVSGDNTKDGQLSDEYNDERLEIEVDSEVLEETAKMEEDYNKGLI
jgi:hypothetical protein